MTTRLKNILTEYSDSNLSMSKKKAMTDKAFNDSASNATFQVVVRILEAKQLVGLDIDPCIEVSIGDQRKVTKTKKSTNATTFDEDFVFDFSLPAAVFLQGIICIEAISDSRLFKKASVIGSFQIDIATIKSQQGSCFLHKWALLLNPDDPLGGAKGYVKCDLIICMPGTVPPSVPETSNGEEDDIEGNLLIPEDFSGNVERQPAQYSITVFEAKDLPSLNSGLVASMKKAFVGDAPKAFLDSYVQVGFAGKTGRTSVKKGSTNPKWNEEIIFTEMFPSLVKIIRIHIKDDNGSVIASTFLDFSLIADNSTNGYLPTFGPSWLDVYGNHRNSTEMSPLNFGVGEGLAYRGSLKISLRVQLMEQVPKKGLHNVDVSNIRQKVVQVDFIPVEKFLLFCTIFEADMIDKKYSGKSAHLEMSFGKEGSCQDFSRKSKDDVNFISEMASNENIFARTLSIPLVSNDKFYCCMPSVAKKWCMHISVELQDYRKRLFMVNRFKKLTKTFETALKEMRHLLVTNQAHEAKKKFQYFLESTSFDVSVIISILEKEYIPTEIATVLDFEKQRQRKRELEALHSFILDYKKREDVILNVQVLNSFDSYCTKMRMLSTEPQCSLPDVFLFLLCDNKKIGYRRFKPEDLIFSTDSMEKGEICGQVHSFFLNPVTKKDNDDISFRSGHMMAYFWIGLPEENCIEYLPPSFRTYGSETFEDIVIPNAIEYTECTKFELRCHLFQGISLMGSDDSGLSDPFVRVNFNGFCRQSRMVEQSLCPLWDECLIFPNVTLYFNPSHISRNEFKVNLQVYDFDKLGVDEFLGQTEVACIVKMATEAYKKPKFPPSLQRCTLDRSGFDAGELLLICELLEQSDIKEFMPPLPPKDVTPNSNVFRIPIDIKPELSDHSLDVLFWGLRDLQPTTLLPVEQPKIQIDWGNGIIESECIVSYKKNPNFKSIFKRASIKISEDPHYQPPFTIRCVDSRAFGRNVLIGTCTVNNIEQYITESDTLLDEHSDRTASKSAFSLVKSSKEHLLKVKKNLASSLPNLTKLNAEEETEVKNSSESLLFDKSLTGSISAIFVKAEKVEQPKTENPPLMHSKSEPVKEKSTEETKLFDWWSKYYASLENFEAKKRIEKPSGKRYQKNENVKTSNKKMFDFGNRRPKSELFRSNDPQEIEESSKEHVSNNTQLSLAKIEIYDKELEEVEEFEGFEDCFQIFNLYRGKTQLTEVDDTSRVVGKFKGKLKLEKVEDSSQIKANFKGLSNEPVKVLVRIYIIKASNLRPSDPTGKADPYLNIILGKTKICDKANKIVAQLNPIFGKLYEIEADFPEDSELTVQVFDWDRLSSDDLMGETKIDLEQRFYSKHRATCGLAFQYDKTGYNCWRDAFKPSQILAKMCKTYSLPDPVYEKNNVFVDEKIFTYEGDSAFMWDHERLALHCLQRWQEVPKVGFHLVPEHVESRTLYLPDKPGMEQGKLELWIDMFTKDGSIPPSAVDISPRKPKSYELRVIVWDTKDVILDDYNALTDVASVDQYIKAFFISPSLDGQQTDVHYRSLNGDGNFNWRFVFKFDYLDAEEKIVYSKKESMFSLLEKEEKLCPTLQFQIWDADVISADDFLGNLSLNLTKLHRGAKNDKQCKLTTFKQRNGKNKSSTINLFDVKRTRGWYPFFRHENHAAMILAGKADLEFQLLTAEEAEKKPAGIGRDEPDPMPLPHRPEISFAWFSSPFKMLKYDIWMSIRWRCLKIFIILLLVFFLCVFIYTLPEAFANKLVQS